MQVPIEISFDLTRALIVFHLTAALLDITVQLPIETSFDLTRVLFASNCPLKLALILLESYLRFILLQPYLA